MVHEQGDMIGEYQLFLVSFFFFCCKAKLQKNKK